MSFKRGSFNFGRILDLTNRDLWTLLAAIDNETLLRACQGTSAEILLRIRGVLSGTAKAYFDDDLSLFENSSAFAVKRARIRIAFIFRKLVKEKRIKDWA